MEPTTETTTAATATGRPHVERLRFDLEEIRAELAQVVREIPPEAFDRAPAPGGPDLKSPQQILQEIGTMEEVSRRWAARQEMPDWNAVCQSLDGDTAEAVLSGLDRVRRDTLAYLEACTEEQLQTPIPLPESWYEYFGGATRVEPEELIRWVAKHEYYHLGQLNTYSFLRAGAAAGTAAA